jgi:hypothetical protein
VAYALAAARAMPGRQVTARVQYLRGPCAAIDVTPSEAELRRFGRQLAPLAAAVASGADLARAPAALGRSVDRCRAEGCGFVVRCHATGPGALSETPARDTVGSGGRDEPVRRTSSAASHAAGSTKRIAR